MQHKYFRMSAAIPGQTKPNSTEWRADAWIEIEYGHNGHTPPSALFGGEWKKFPYFFSQGLQKHV